MSWAELTRAATRGLTSKVCGSVLGLLKIAVTATYRPPIWLITLAYSFSAPIAVTTPARPPDDALSAAEQPAAASTATLATAAATGQRDDFLIVLSPSLLTAGHRCIAPGTSLVVAVPTQAARVQMPAPPFSTSAAIRPGSSTEPERSP